MPLTVTLEDCHCPPGSHVDLESIALILTCVECGQLSAAFNGSIDAMTRIVDELRRRQVTGTRVQHSDGRREVIATRQPEAEAG